MSDTPSTDAARASLLARLGALKGTKLYDLAAAMPIIAWTLICAEHQVPALVQYLAAADLKTADTLFFARAAYETGMISRGRLVRDVYENLRFRLRGSTDDRADDVRKRVGEMIAGVRVRDLERLTPRVLSGVLPRLYPQMLERAYAHQDAGVPVYILTAASQEMADLLARVLAFDGGLGSRSEIVDGRYTGRPAGPFNYREGKVLSMRDVAERDAIDLGDSYAYSDSESDLPMLRAVGYAVVVNPDATLRRIALKEGWEVIELVRLGRRLKVLAALGAGTALASLGRAVLERGAAAGGAGRARAGRWRR